MMERDEKGLTRPQRALLDAFYADTRDDLLENEKRDLACQGVDKTIQDIFHQHVFALMDALEKEDEQ